jgi:signal transduction histidine kinase
MKCGLACAGYGGVMRTSKVRIERSLALSPLAGARWFRALPQAVGSRSVATLLGRDSALSVDGLDAGIRTLAVGTVLALALLGYGRSQGQPLGIAGDPVLIALGLVVYNLLVVAILGVPWRKPPGFFLFLLDWAVVSGAVLVTGGFFSPFLILYYALVIGAALRMGLTRSLFLVAVCATVYAGLSAQQPTPIEAFHLPALAVGITSLLMVAVTSVAMKRAVEVEARKVEREERTAEQLRLLNNLTRVVLSGSPDLERVMRTVAAVSSQALEADSGLAVLLESKAQSPKSNVTESDFGPWTLDFRPTALVSDCDPNPAHLSSGELQVAQAAVSTQAPVLVDNVQTDPQYARAGGFPGMERPGSRVCTVACAPFLLSGGVIGVLFVARCAPRPFGETEVSLLTAIGQQMAVAVRLARLYDMQRERASRSEEREQLERDLLSIVSHELRTPLTSIKTCVEALSNAECGTRNAEYAQAVEVPGMTLAPAQSERLLQNIGRSTDRLIVLVNELLDMARLRAGRVSLNLQALNVGDVVQDVAAQVQPLLDAREQSLALDLPAHDSHRWQMLAVSADRRRLEQVLLNLLSNANKFSPAGSKIMLGATPREGKVKVFVRDDGPGIDPEEQHRIFEKYYQGSLPNVGTGLGLAIARSIVELHGGDIGVESKPGRGSTFFFTLDSAATNQPS